MSFTTTDTIPGTTIKVVIGQIKGENFSTNGEYHFLGKGWYISRELTVSGHRTVVSLRYQNEWWRGFVFENEENKKEINTLIKKCVIKEKRMDRESRRVEKMHDEIRKNYELRRINGEF